MKQHTQGNTYHGLCYTSRGALAGMKNSSMGNKTNTSKILVHISEHIILYVCMYVCMYECMLCYGMKRTYVCMYVYMYICMYNRTHT